MRLNEEEYYKYLSIHPKLVYYVGMRKKLISSETSLEEFMNYSVEDKYPIRNAMYENIHLLNDYIKENSESLSEEDKEIIRGFKYFKQGTFYVIKLTKKHALFFGDKYVYGVFALNDPFELFWGNDLPVMVQAVLLPYKGKIIYDGIISSYPIHLGRGIRSSIKNDFALSEGKYGIITELPEKIDENKLENSLENELLIMMKTKASREHNWYEIETMLEENPELMGVYIKDLGRINSRRKKKELKGLGIKKQCFAMYNNTIIASSGTQKELEKKIKGLISDKEKIESIYYFKI
jgi:hypothetical protein